VTDVVPLDPVTEGQDLDVEITVENQGGQTTTQQVTLDIDANQNGTFETEAATTDVTVAGGDSQTVTLTYTTQNGDSPEVDLRGTTEDDTTGLVETATVQQSSITANDIDNLNEGSSGQQQTFEFALNTDLKNKQEVVIDVSDANAAGVDYAGATISASGNNNAEIRDGGDTLVFTAQGNTNGQQSITITNLNVAPGSSGSYDVTYTRQDDGNFDTDIFEIQ
jgi:cytochrome c oxidase assembly protein Cox11